MEWWNKMVLPMKRVWIIVATRLGIRKQGLLKLRHDVRSCEYQDIHVMWEMLKKSETEQIHGVLPLSSSFSSSSSSSSSTPRKMKKKPLWKIFISASRGPHLNG